MPEIIPLGSYLGKPARKMEVRGLLLTESCYEAGANFPLHTHEGAFLYFVISGACTEKFGSREQTDLKRSLVFHGPGQSHQTKWESVGQCLHIGFTPERWQAIKETCPNLDSSARPRRNAPTVKALRIYREFCDLDPFSALSIEGLTLELLADIRRGYTEGRPSSRLLSRTKEALDCDCAANWSLDRLAREIGCSPSYLARAFRAETGMTLGTYARSRRIEQACVDLRKTESTVGEIALRNGFYDQSHFTRRFQNAIGVSPTEYRKLHRC